MVKQIKVAPVSRIEGHAQITIDVEDSGKVSDARPTSWKSEDSRNFW